MLARKTYPWIASVLLHSLLFLPRGIFNTTAGGVGSLDFTLEQGSEQPSIPSEKSQESIPRTERRTAMLRNAPELGAAAEPPVEAPADEPTPASSIEGSGPEKPLEPEASSEVFPAPTAGGEATAEIGWEGTVREIIRRETIRFPEVLSVSGHEADVEARITVSPLGTVSKVEITRSSGYTEIDARVEAALRGSLFSRDFGVEKKSAIGIMKFHFRLERLD